MSLISKIVPPSGSTGYDLRASAIPSGEVDSTSTSTVFTATVPGITELTDGVCVFLKNGVVTSASGFTLNINGLGAKPVYTNLAAATRDTTLFNVAYTMLFVYDSTRVDGGCWVCYRGYQEISAVVPVTYSLSISNNVITLTGSDGSTSSITLPVYNGTVTVGGGS